MKFLNNLCPRARYALLPTPNSKEGVLSRVATLSSFRRRACLTCLSLLLVIGGIVSYYGAAEVRTKISDIRYGYIQQKILPPTFDHYYELERAYPQHNASLPFPEGENGRFMWVSNPHWGLGWNNIFQALYMNSLMAYLSNRAFVFQPYTWWIGPEPYVEYGDSGDLVPSRIPLAALIDGPMAGGPFPPDRPAPRAVTKEFFEQVCPRERRTRISIEETNRDIKDASVVEVLDKYVSILANSSDTCVELYGDMEHPFDFQHFGSTSMTTIYRQLIEAPIMTGFNWAPLVLSALRTNAPELAPGLASDPPPNLIEDLMVVHIRRGDYEEHCRFIAEYSNGYMGWNSMPGLGDKFVVPPRNADGAYRDEIMRHCWPSINQIALRALEVKSEWEMQYDAKPLRRLYVMTNGKRGWVTALKEKLMESGEWDVVLTSKDLVLDFEQKYVGQAIDMAIAERAAVLIGNGFSSMTANIVLMRSIHNLPLASNHFL